jgi:hypothetical protein
MKARIKQINDGEEVVAELIYWGMPSVKLIGRLIDRLIHRIVNIKGRTYVEISIGSLAGAWKSNYGMPQIGSEYDVEINIEKSWEDLTKTRLKNESSYRVSEAEGKVFFRGKIEDCEDDLVWFRLTEGCLIMIHANSKPSRRAKTMPALLLLLTMNMPLFAKRGFR